MPRKLLIKEIEKIPEGTRNDGCYSVGMSMNRSDVDLYSCRFLSTRHRPIMLVARRQPSADRSDREMTFGI